MIPAVLGALAGGGVSDAFELIQTQTVGAGGASSVTFSSIPGTYKHLQIRTACLLNTGTSGLTMRFNGSSATAYAFHNLIGNGSTAASEQTTSQTGIDSFYVNASISAGVMDILDYTSTSKNKTTRSLQGFDNNGTGFIMLRSGLWYATPAAITQIVFTVGNGTSTFAQYSTFSLYGVK